MPTPVPVVPPTITEIINTGVSTVQLFGLLPFVMFGGFVGAAYMLFKRMKAGAR